MANVGGMRKPTGKAEKPKDRKKVIKRLWEYLRHYRILFIVSILLTILSNICALINPIISGLIIDEIKKPKIDFDVINKYTIMMIILYIFSFIFTYISALVMTRIGKNIVFKMRQDSFKNLTSLPISYFDTRPIGDIISTMSYDIDTVNTSLSNDLVTICSSLVTVIGSFVMMLYLSPLLCLIFVVTIPVSIIFTKLMLKKTRPLFSKRSRELGLLNGYAEEMITGIKTIKSFNQEENILTKYKNKNEEASYAAYIADYYGCVMGPGMNFLNQISLALICIFGSLLNIYQGFSYGKIASFVQYSRKFSGPIFEIANIFTDLQSALAAAERVFGLIDEKPEAVNDKENTLVIKDTQGEIIFDHIKFSYNKKDIIIHDFSLNVQKGKTIAIVGKTGAGKSTLVNLLMRFYELDEGSITLDGKDIRDIDRKALRSMFAMVLQDTWLFEGSVFDNLRYGNPDITLEDCIEACKKSHIHSFIMQLPNQYDTILTENGQNISKGQKQLLTIARAMLLKFSILILDEATSNVDTQTEMEIQDAMSKLMENKTSFIIAHRLSTIKNADKILLLSHGDIIEIGTHEELMAQKQAYYKLFNSQFEN